MLELFKKLFGKSIRKKIETDKNSFQTRKKEEKIIEKVEAQKDYFSRAERRKKWRESWNKFKR